MKSGRLIAVAVVVCLAGAGGVYAVAPEGQGKQDKPEKQDKQEKKLEKKIVAAGPDHLLELATMGGGGSRIGVAVRDVEAVDVTRQKLPSEAGAVVEDLDDDAPAAKAGLKAGDVVVAFDGERVRSARQLERLVDETPAGRTVKLSLLRAGEKMDLSVTPETSGMARLLPRRDRPFAFSGPSRDEARDLAREPLERRGREPRIERDRRFSMPAFDFEWDEGGGFMPKLRGRLGVTASELSDQLAGYFGVESGVLVSNVAADSPAAKAGVKAGDVITAVNGTAVTDPEGLRRAIAEAEGGKAVTLSVMREKKTLSLSATIEAPEDARPRPRRMV